MKLNALIIGFGLLCFSMSVWCQMYKPKSDDEILEKLPISQNEKLRISKTRQALTTRPDDYELAIKLANDYIVLGRTQSDPRYYSYAEAVLARWLQPNYPRALLLQATVLQNRHDFKNAANLLKQALTRHPGFGQAWLTLAAIYEAQGNYPEALKSCLSMLRNANDSLATSVCIHSALSLAGQAQSSYRQLSAINLATGSAEEIIWACTVLAELAERLGLSEEAENWYRKALSQPFRSVYCLTSYADFLLDQKRPEDVVRLLKNETQADALLLRLTLAEQKLQSSQVNDHIELIQNRFSAAKQRQDKTHEGDKARFNLYLLNDAATALQLAQSNWTVQKEPRDARILLEAAIAAEQPAAAAPVVQFIEKTGLEDKRLNVLLQTAKG